MNTTEPTPPHSGFYDSIRRMGLTRTEDRWIGGVCAGVAHRYGLDPILVRGLVVVTSLFVGLGTLAYGVAWALLPESKDGRIHLEEAGRGHFDIALAGAAALVVLALSQGVWWWGGPSGWTTLWLLVLGAVIVVIMLSRNSDATPSQPTPPTPTATPPPPSPPTTPAQAPSTETLTMTASTPTATPTPVRPSPPPPPAAKPSSGSLILLTLGLCLLVAAGILLVHQAGLLDASPGLLIGGSCLAIIGIAVVLGGLRGQTQGGLGSLGLIIAIIMVPSALVGVSVPSMSKIFGPNGMVLGDATFVPASTETAAAGFSLGIGELLVDLTELELQADDEVTIPVGVGVGELRVIVPDDWEITAELQSRVGDVNARLSDGWDRTNGSGRFMRGEERTLSSGANAVVWLHHALPGAPTVHIDARAGVGSITIEEER